MRDFELQVPPLGAVIERDQPDLGEPVVVGPEHPTLFGTIDELGGRALVRSMEQVEN